MYTSRFRNDTHDILTVVNRVGRATKGSDGALSIPCEPGDVFHDVYRGRQITEAICETGFAKAVLSLEPFGIGAVSVVGKGKPPPSPAFMERMREMTRQPLDTFSKAWKFLPQTMADARAKTAVPESAPAGMVLVKGGLYDWSVQGNIQQGDNLPFAVDVQYPWEPHPMRDHRQLLEVHDLFVHVHPVTNAQYKEFLDKTGWLPPVTDQNWLADWSIGSDGVRDYPAGGGKRPVVWVSRDDAKAYCQHHGLRLPHDWEWQWFAQGNSSRDFPWGNDAACGNCMPPKSTARTQPPAYDVDAHPKGRSAAGIEDLVGNVWQWTDEFCDAHTCMSTVRGGTYYAPTCVRPTGESCKYYFAFPANLNTHNTWLVLSESMDRTKSFGFRCVADAVPNPPPCAGQLCLDAPTVLQSGLVVDLTGDGGVDWMHLGGVVKTYPMSIDVKASGSGAIVPGVLGADVPTDHTMDTNNEVQATRCHQP